MGLLDQLFRHKDDLPGADSATPRQVDPAAGPIVKRDTRSSARGVGAIAAAVGIQPGRAMPAEFEIALGDLLPRTPEIFLRPGTHDASRVLKVPIGEVAGGLAKGRAEIPLARLVALAPDVFHPGSSDVESQRIRLPLQKLLQQIGASVSAAGGKSAAGIPLFAAPASQLQPFRVAGKAEQPRSVEAMRAKAAQPPANITLGPASAHENPPALHASVSEPRQKPLELRPHAGVATSTTLRAVILGGKALAPHATAATIVLAPTGQASATAPKAPEHPSVQLSGENAATNPRGE